MYVENVELEGGARLKHLVEASRLDDRRACWSDDATTGPQRRVNVDVAFELDSAIASRSSIAFSRFSSSKSSIYIEETV